MIATAAAATLFPAAAMAVPIEQGSFIPLTAELEPGSAVSFDFEPDGPLLVDLVFALTGDATDLEQVTVDYGLGVTGLDDVTMDPEGGADSASLFIEDFFVDGPFSVSFFDGIANPVSIAGTAEAATAPVPLPAPAMLLAGGLAAMGALRLRKREA